MHVGDNIYLCARRNEMAYSDGFRYYVVGVMYSTLRGTWRFEVYLI